MIQRKQTIWLLLAAVCGFLSFKLPFYTGHMVFDDIIPVNGSENLLITMVTCIVSMLALVIIFLFKKRTLQLRLCLLGILLEALLIFLYYRATQKFAGGTYALTALLQGLIVFFFFIAARDINRDAKKVKESEKLR